MEITRRRLLSALSAAGLLTVIPTGRANAADAAADSARLLSNTVGVFAGTEASNSRTETADKRAAIGKAARANLKSMDAAGPGELFAGLVLGTDEGRLNTAYKQLYEIALATRAPGAAPDLYGDEAVQRRVVDGLAWLHERYYGDQSKGYYGNWFYWEIGLSQFISKTLVLLADEVKAYRPDLLRTYVASMDAYLRNGTDGDVNLDSRFHTGANLADITTNRILQGALLIGDGGGAPTARPASARPSPTSSPSSRRSTRTHSTTGSRTATTPTAPSSSTRPSPTPARTGRACSRGSCRPSRSSTARASRTAGSWCRPWWAGCGTASRRSSSRAG